MICRSQWHRNTRLETEGIEAHSSFGSLAVSYGTACLPDIARDFGETLQKCQRVTRESMKQEPMIRKVMGPLLKAFAPLL